MRKFFRRNDNGIIAGICEGLGKFTETDPDMWRLGAVLLFILTYSGIGLVYIITWIVVPEED